MREIMVDLGICSSVERCDHQISRSHAVLGVTTLPKIKISEDC